MDPEYFIMIFLKCDQQDHPQDPAGNHFSGTHGQAVINVALPDAETIYDKAVAVDQYQGHYERVCENGRQRSTPFPSAQSISTQCAE